MIIKIKSETRVMGRGGPRLLLFKKNGVRVSFSSVCLFVFCLFICFCLKERLRVSFDYFFVFFCLFLFFV